MLATSSSDSTRLYQKHPEKVLDAAGAFSTSLDELLVANSLGVSAYHRTAVAHLMTVAMGGNSSGYAGATARDVTQLDPDAIAHTAVDKALRSQNPTEIEPGAYTVILEEEAVGSSNVAATGNMCIRSGNAAKATVATSQRVFLIAESVLERQGLYKDQRRLSGRAGGNRRPGCIRWSGAPAGEPRPGRGSRRRLGRRPSDSRLLRN